MLLMKRSECLLRLQQRLTGLLFRLLARQCLLCLLLLFRLLRIDLLLLLFALLCQFRQRRLTLCQQGKVLLPYRQRSTPVRQIGQLLT